MEVLIKSAENGFIVIMNEKNHVFNDAEDLMDFMGGIIQPNCANIILPEKIIQSNVGKRIINLLCYNLGLTTWNEIAIYRETDFLRIPNLGRKSVREIKEELKKRGLKLNGTRNNEQASELSARYNLRGGS